MNIINKTTNGIIFTCQHCKAYHIEYKNLNFNFNQEQLDHFIGYLSSLNGPAWEKRNCNSPYKRKIIIPSRDASLNMLFTNDELKELITLLQKPQPQRQTFLEKPIYKLLIVKNIN